jgi:hypothetical protein
MVLSQGEKKIRLKGSEGLGTYCAMMVGGTVLQRRVNG